MHSSYLSQWPTIGASTTAFFLLNKLIQRHTNPTRLVATGSTKRMWVWSNTVCSLVHSFITSVGSLLCYYQEPEFMNDLIDTQSWAASKLIALSTGYFVYDTIDILLGVGMGQWELLTHHAVVLGAFNVALVNNKYLGFGMCSLLLEINSVFLHIRKMLKMLGYSGSRVYILNMVMVMSTIVLFRFFTSGWMLMWLLRNRHKINLVAWLVGLVGMLVILPTNVGLFVRLWQSDLSRKKSKMMQTNSLVVD